MSRYANYITSTSQNFSAVTGNCSMLALSRLSATYVPKDNVEEHNRKVIELYSNYVVKVNKSLVTLFPEGVTSMKNMKLRVHNVPGVSTGLAIPVEWGFATLLEEIIDTRNPTILFCSDVENGGVDGHTGDYRTGNFADWCLSEGVARGERTVGRKKRGLKHYEVYAWNLVFNNEEARTCISQQNKEFNEFFKSIAKSNNLSEAIAATKQEIEEQKRILSDAWIQWRPEESDIETPFWHAPEAELPPAIPHNREAALELTLNRLHSHFPERNRRRRPRQLRGGTNRAPQQDTAPRRSPHNMTNTEE